MDLYLEDTGLTLSLLYQKSLLSVHLKDNYLLVFKTLSPRVSLRYFLIVLVITCTSAMTHTIYQTPRKYWIPFLRILVLLQNPVGSPWYFYFSMIVLGCLYPRYNYKQ